MIRPVIPQAAASSHPLLPWRRVPGSHYSSAEMAAPAAVMPVFVLLSAFFHVWILLWWIPSLRAHNTVHCALLGLEPLGVMLCSPTEGSHSSPLLWYLLPLKCSDFELFLPSGFCVRLLLSFMWCVRRPGVRILPRGEALVCTLAWSCERGVTSQSEGWVIPGWLGTQCYPSAWSGEFCETVLWVMVKVPSFIGNVFS